jgi:hypothetical protein
MTISDGVELGAAVFTATLMGAAVIRGKYIAMEEKEHAEELAHIGELEDATFPPAKLEPIFSRTDPKDEKSPLRGPVIPLAMLRSIAKCKPNFENKALDRYVRHIQNAVAYAYEYIAGRLNRDKLFRGAIDDPTSSVMSYVIMKLGQDCVSFVDNDQVVKTLQALSNFIKRFASARDKKTNDSFRFVHLIQVHDELETAIFLLKEHMLSLSLSEKVKQLLAVSDEAAQGLIRCLVKMIVSNEYWHLLDTFIPERLQKGLLRHRYHYKEGWLLKAPRTDSEVRLPDSMMSEWIKTNTQDYLLALSLEEDKTKKKDLIGPKKFDVAEPLDYRHIYHIFSKSRNFLTLTVAPTDDATATSSFVTITQPGLAKARVMFASKLNKLCHAVIDTRRVCAKLRDKLIEFGQYYGSLPEKTVYSFAVLSEFRDMMMKDNLDQLTELSAMYTDNHKAMLNEAEDDGLYDELKQLLEDTIQKKMSSGFTELVTSHKNRLGHKHQHLDMSKLRPVLVDDTDSFIKLIHELADKYGISPKITQPVSVDAAPVIVKNATMEMYKTLGKISLRLEEIEKTEQDRAINLYNKMYAYLLALLLHSREIYNDRTEERRNKAAHLQTLLLFYNQEFLKFLAMPLARRQSLARDFVYEVETSLKSPLNNYIDTHKPGTLKVFDTKTRGIAGKFLNECELMQRQLLVR